MAIPNPRKIVVRKKSAPVTAEPNIHSRLHDLRRAAGLSQEALGSQGFISAPGWIKVENGQRKPSEKLLAAFVDFLVGEEVIRASQKDDLLKELCVLKYVHHRSGFLRQMARDYQKALSPVAIQTAPER